MRHSHRETNQLRPVTIETGISMNAAGSCLIKAGNTHVLCTASVDDRVPPFLRGKNSGWVTAEYGMLPGSTSERMQREAAKGKQGGRTVEIQRLIGRSLRAVVDLKALGQRQIIVDCDVLQADGGTRTASITGGFVALHLACQALLKDRRVRTMPITDHLAAVSCGIVAGKPVLDMDYLEDSNAQADTNFVMTQSGKLVEVQGSAESSPFSTAEFHDMMNLASGGITQLIDIQRAALGLA